MVSALFLALLVLPVARCALGSDASTTCEPTDAAHACPNSTALRLAATTSPAPCACLLGCACGVGPLYSTTLACTCENDLSDEGAFVWLDVHVVDPLGSVNFSVVSPDSSPSIAASGTVSNTTSALSTLFTGVNPLRVVFPVTFPKGTHPVSFSFSFAASGPVGGGVVAASITGGMTSCTVFDLRVLAHANRLPSNSSAQVTWNPLPAPTGAIAVVHVLLQVTGNANGPYTDFMSVPGNLGAANVMLPRQCALYHIKTLTVFTPPGTESWPASNTSCPLAYPPQSFYLRQPPAAPEEVNATVVNPLQVAVEWRLVDSGGCLPLVFRVTLFNAGREPLTNANITVDVGDFPESFKYTLSVPEVYKLGVGERVFVGVVASNDAGTSYSGTSEWFWYTGPVRISFTLAAAIVASVMLGAITLVCAVGCCYRKCISLSKDYSPL